uniref:RING-type domain-containing protein n=1 Tax=Fundulus heteroclitus TaxID=8078 RepID=A0A3Q2QV65_FUNHE
MAEKIALTFRDPVSLSCKHSFCSSCLQKFWERAGYKNCPICKRKSSKDDPLVNFTLKELADSFTRRQKCRSSETEKGAKQLMVVCNEQRALCPGCEFSLHQSHKVIPVEQAVSELKEQLRSDLKYLQDKRNTHKQVEKTYENVIQHSKKQLLTTERQIRAEFNKLHQFLKEESRLAALREEEEQKGKTISREMIQDQISSLSDKICRKTTCRSSAVLKPLRLVSGALIDVAKHLGNLSFRLRATCVIRPEQQSAAKRHEIWCSCRAQQDAQNLQVML